MVEVIEIPSLPSNVSNESFGENEIRALARSISSSIADAFRVLF